METQEFDFENRILATEYTPADTDIDFSLRPRTLLEYVGQEKAKENLNIYIEAAKMRGESLDHILLYGPPGLGKTTLSNIIANEMGVNIRTTSGPAIEKPGDLAAILTNLADAKRSSPAAPSVAVMPVPLICTSTKVPTPALFSGILPESHWLRHLTT